jgi:hypothetical protein
LNKNKILAYLGLIIITFSCKREGFSLLEPIKYNLSQETDSLLQIDYLKITYPFLDSNFLLKQNSKYFNEAIAFVSAKDSVLHTYTDSLTVYLNYYFKNIKQANIAKLQITYTWQRAALHLWLSAMDTKTLANSLGQTHPYKLISYLKDTKTNSPIKDSAILKLRTTIKKTFNYKMLDTLSNKMLLAFAFYYNPLKQGMQATIDAKQHNKHTH